MNDALNKRAWKTFAACYESGFAAGIKIEREACAALAEVASTAALTDPPAYDMAIEIAADIRARS